MGFTMAEKNKIAAEFAPRYRKAGKSEKSRILDEYLALSGSKWTLPLSVERIKRLA